MPKAKKNIEPKPRADKYEAKVYLKVDLNEALNILAKKANKVVKERQDQKK